MRDVHHLTEALTSLNMLLIIMSWDSRTVKWTRLLELQWSSDFDWPQRLYLYAETYCAVHMS